MGKVDMEVDKKTKAEFEKRGQQERIKYRFKVTLMLASYRRGDKDQGRLTIRLTDDDVGTLRRIHMVPPGTELCFAVRLLDSGLIYVSPHNKGYALSGNDIQVTTLARMNVQEPPSNTAKQCDAIMEWSPSNSWSMNVPKDFLQYWDFKADGTKIKQSAGRKAGSANKETASKRQIAKAEPVAAPIWPTVNIYPIQLPATDNGYFVSSNQLVRDVWLRLKPDGITWYALDGTLREDALTIDVRDMRDNVWGGIGKVIHTLRVPISDFTAGERVAMRERVMRTQTDIAEREYISRATSARRQKVLAIRKELFGV